MDRIRVPAAICAAMVGLIAACSAARSTANPPYTLIVTVRAGGDCHNMSDTFQVQGMTTSAQSAPTPLGSAGSKTRVRSQPPGLVPCEFTFPVSGLPAANSYFVVDQTLGEGWGPWSLTTLQKDDWKVTVTITDLN